MSKYKNRAKKIAEARKKNTQIRNDAIKKRFDELYNQKRKRYDDAIQQLAQERNLSTNTILSILRK